MLPCPYGNAVFIKDLRHIMSVRALEIKGEHRAFIWRVADKLKTINLAQTIQRVGINRHFV